jgi:outer membrane receptor protein involved in Fe transport
MKEIRRKPLPEALALARLAARSAVTSVAVGLCLATAVHAQTVEGNIIGNAKPGATVTLTAPGGRTSQVTAGPNGTFSFQKLTTGSYTVSSGSVTRNVLVAAGVDSRVSLESEAVAGEKITVTGSRIERDTFNSTSPVLVMTRDETLMSGFNSTTAALQSTAVTTGGGQINNAFAGFVTDGGPGANTLGLRGLGATRTLVLLNGRRVAPAGTRGAVGAADLNVFPTAIVDRIEVLKDGASSIYGSDAVAGVINVITRKNIKGVTVEAQYNWPEAGGGEEVRASGTFGYVADKGWFSGSLEYYDRQALKWGDRAWMNCQTDYLRTVSANGTVGAWGSADFIDPRTGMPKCYGITGTGNSGVTINTLGTGSIAGVGAVGAAPGQTTFTRWRPNANITTGLIGFEGVGAGATNINLRDTLDPRIFNNDMISPARLYTGFFQGGYNIGVLGNAEVYGEALLSRRESSQTSGARQLTLDYTRGNPLIPTYLAGQAGNLQAGPTAIAPGPIQYRAFISAGNYRSEQEVDYTKVLGGLKGNLPFKDWKYDGVVTYAKSDASYMLQSWLTDRVTQSLDVVRNASGAIVCRNPANGCVPAPVLTPALLGGAIPQDWMNWTYVNDTGHTKYDETTTTLNTNGTLFQMPHGPVRAALGAEYRRAKIDDTPSIDSQNSNLYNLTSAAVTRGSDSVWELYGEAELPILRAVNWAEELTLNASYRYTDYKSYGGDSTYKVGALWSPVREVTFRAAQGTSYRAPALFEQFIGGTTGFLSATGDPCNDYGSRNPTTNRYRNCASEGLPTNFASTSSITSVTIGGHDAGLKAETSKNKTLGVIFQPTLPSGWGDLSLAIDYYDIKVDNGVDRVGTGNILALCYDSPDFRNGNRYCQLVTRAPAGTNRALSVNNSYVNVSTDVVKGYDYTMRYVQKVGPGTFRFNGVLTWYKEQANKLFPTDPLLTFNNTIGNPDMTFVGDISYTWQNWRGRWGVEWIGAMSSYDFFGENPATSQYKMDTPSVAYHNLSVEYKASKWSVIVGVRNVADKEPPPISQGFANRMGNAPLYSGYDYVGRTWFVNGQYAF